MPRSCMATLATSKPEVGGQLAVDPRDHFGLSAFERAVDVDRARHLPDLRDDLVAQPLQLGDVVAAHKHVERRLRSARPA